MASLPEGDGPGYERLRERAETALLLNQESPAVEFKSGAPWPTLKIDIIKTVLAMSNLRDGGVIIIGRPQSDAVPEGVSIADLESYDPDIIVDQIDEYAVPRATISMIRFISGGYRYIAFEVSEFDEDPVICKKAFDPDLKRGGIYVRPYTGRPRSTIVMSAEETRSVLDLAIDKKMASFEGQAHRRGYALSPGSAQAFLDEIEDLGDA